MTKLHFRQLAIILLPLLLIALPFQQTKAQDANVSYQSDGISYQTFYDQLSPYGQWVGDPQYGNVWVPYVEPGFRPYATDGHWVMTDQGNMWVSEQPWAWAAYHYGRWTYNPYYGWVWIPGYEWAPAWVNWRSGGGYYGWAPLGPGQVYGGVYDYPSNYWVFVNPGYLYNPYVYNYYGREDAFVYIGRTNYVTYGVQSNGYYGPRREEIERVSGQPIQVYHISNSTNAGAVRMSGNEVNIYRPAVNRSSANTARPMNIIPGNSHPIGSPQPIAGNHANTLPAFHQEHPQQQQRAQQQNMQEPRQRQQQFQQQPQQRQTQFQEQPQQQQRAQPEQQQRSQQQQPQQQQRQQQPQQQRQQNQQRQQRTQQQKTQPKQQGHEQERK